MDFFKLSEKEFAEIEAELDDSLENLSEDEISDTIEETPQCESFTEFSLAESQVWKEFIEKEKQHEEIQIKKRESFSGLIKDLRESTAKVEIEVEPILTAPVIWEEPEIEIVEINEEIQDKEFNELAEMENRLREIELMAEEEELSRLLMEWQVKEEILIVEEIKREEVIVEKQIVKEKAEIRRKEENRLRKEAERIKEQEEEVKKKLKEEFEQKEKEKEALETKKMVVEDLEGVEYRKIWLKEDEIKREIRENVKMIEEDESSHKMRKIIPKTCSIRFVNRFNQIQIQSNKKKYPLNLNLPTPELQKQSIPPKKKSIFPPERIMVLKFPEHIECPTNEEPTLKNCFPYPLNINSPEFSHKLEGIRSISGLGLFKNLQELTLSLNKIRKIQNLPPTLVKLDLSQNLLKEVPELELLILEELILDQNEIEVISSLKKCLNLRKISVNNNKLRTLGCLQENSLLQGLYAYRNKIKVVDSDTFIKNRYLSHLDLGRNKLRQVNFLDKLLLLHTLILYENKISEISELKLPILQEIWLNGNSLRSLNFIKDCPQLEILKLEDNALSSVSPFSCSLLSNCNISFNNIPTFKEILTIIKSAPNLINFSYNDNPFISTFHQLEEIYSTVAVKSLVWIQELNNTPRTSVEGPRQHLKYGDLLKNFELKQQQIFEIKSRRGHPIIECASESMKEFIIENTSSVFNKHYKLLEAELTTTGLLSHWYEARSKLYQRTVAAQSIQTAWRSRKFRLNWLLKRYLPFKDLIVKIESVFKGHLVRKSYRNRHKKEATKIQAVFRGYSLRCRMKKVFETVSVPLDLEEFAEVDLNDINTNLDFEENLFMPTDSNLDKFLNTLALPPIRTTPKITPKLPEQEYNAPVLPPINKPKAEEINKNIEEWGFLKEETKVALKLKYMKDRRRKTKKQFTAQERLDNFRRMAGK